MLYPVPADVVADIEEEEAGHGHVELGGPQGVGRHGGDNLRVDKDVGVLVNNDERVLMLEFKYAGIQRCKGADADIEMRMCAEMKE